MTKVLIIGGGGLIGQKIAQQLNTDGLQGAMVSKVTLFDMVLPESAQLHDTAIVGRLDDAELLEKAIADRPDVIFHLAAAVSGEAEQDFAMGWGVNGTDMWTMLETLRIAHEQDGYCPRFVFASSLAVFGGPMPDIIPDTFHCAPQSSYGAQKVVGETYVSDFSRKGYIDGISLRLPTVSVRPGKPNKAASSCFSSIIREPLNGEEAVLPLPVNTRHMHASPRSAAGFFRHAAVLDTDLLMGVRAITMPSVSCTIEQQINALQSVAGNNVAALIRHSEDPAVARIVTGWPKQFDTPRARDLGFKVESNFDEILAVYLKDQNQNPT